ncbi:MAG: type I-B CRISPR-associated protein Cas8b1/Cst1, partial [Spirochaetes bacterium]|nr:type I-B CRISPR-associated protein Cas8b1/Cst1 [Spirochaetota bacterium]
MCLNKNEYAIYPSNWLMRAGIVGFLRILDDNSTNTYNNYIENGTLNFNFDLSDFFTIYFKYVKNNKINLKFFYNNSKVANNAPKDSNKNKDLNAIKEYFQGKTDDNELLCTFCNERKAIKRDNKYVILDEVHGTPLGASPSNLANFFWEGEPNLF